MFKRRHPLPLWWRLRGWLWPHIGWRRLGIYALKRMLRLPGTPHGIAAGIAAGAAVSFTPFVGFHTLLGCLLAVVVRGNFIAVVVGTLLGNPWTFPFIWWLAYQTGQLILGHPPEAASLLAEGEFGDLLDRLGALIWPITVGGVPLGLAVGLALYWPVQRAVAAYQEARRRRRLRRQALRRGTSALPGVS